MNYKKILKNRDFRLKLLSWLWFIPDKMMIKLQYRIKTGRRLNLKNPKRYSEKIQWYKLNYKNPLLVQCVDKYDVREYVKSKELENILVPCYGVYDNVDEINWDKLPKQFVMKDTLGAGGFDVIVVEDKDRADIYVIKNKIEKWLQRPHRIKNGGREWPYYCGKKHRILIEKYLDASHIEGGLLDYKFFCFDGKAKYMRITGERQLGVTERIATYDMSFNRLDIIRKDLKSLTIDVEKPYNFNQLVKYAEILSESFPHVRVDMYDLDNKIYFGELTFFGSSGYLNYIPDSFDYEIGKNFYLPDIVK